jgi:hypothetical protein
MVASMRRLFGRDDRLLLGLLGLLLGRGFLVGVALLVLLILRRLVGFLDQILLTDVLVVGDAEHHHHVVGFLLRQRVARHVPPVEIALVFVAQQAGMRAVLAHDGDLGRI